MGPGRRLLSREQRGAPGPGAGQSASPGPGTTGPGLRPRSRPWSSRRQAASITVQTHLAAPCGRPGPPWSGRPRSSRTARRDPRPEPHDHGHLDDAVGGLGGHDPADPRRGPAASMGPSCRMRRAGLIGGPRHDLALAAGPRRASPRAPGRTGSATGGRRCRAAAEAARARRWPRGPAGAARPSPSRGGGRPAGAAGAGGVGASARRAGRPPAGRPHRRRAARSRDTAAAGPRPRPAAAGPAAPAGARSRAPTAHRAGIRGCPGPRIPGCGREGDVVIGPPGGRGRRPVRTGRAAGPGMPELYLRAGDILASAPAGPGTAARRPGMPGGRWLMP